MRTHWTALPETVREVIESRAGRIHTAETIEEGLTCSVALSLRTADGDQLFLKGVDAADQAGRRAQLWETVVNPWVLDVGPRLRWHAEVEGWFFLAFDHVEGCHARLGPESPDHEAVADLHRRMQKLPRPDGDIPAFRDRLSPFLPSWQAELLDGDHLLHTDTNPHNLLIRDDGRAFLVDWAMPARGPAWVDAAATAVRLMEDGTPPADARRWLDQFESWRQADPMAVRAYVAGTCAHWERAVGAKGARPSNARVHALVD